MSSELLHKCIAYIYVMRQESSMTISSLGLFTEVSPNFGLLVGECVYVFRKLTIKYRP